MTQFLHETYLQAMSDYSAEIAQAQADFTIAQSRGDIGGAAEAGRRLADGRVRASEFDRMSREHAAAINPPPPRQLSKEEILAIPDEYQTPENLAAAGVFDSPKYGQVEPSDPLFQAGKLYAARTRNQFGR
jgi:hypothetical protein